LRFKASLDWWSGGEAKVVGPEFKPQYRKKKRERKKERKMKEMVRLYRAKKTQSQLKRRVWLPGSGGGS
jgi:hypothetical protein